MGINFVMVFSAQHLAGAPHNASRDAELSRTEGRPRPRKPGGDARYRPGLPRRLTTVRVRDRARSRSATRPASSPIAIRADRASRWRRACSSSPDCARRRTPGGLYDAVGLKTLGADASRLLGPMPWNTERSLATAIFGVIAGGLAAWVIVTRIMQLEFVFVWQGRWVPLYWRSWSRFHWGLFGYLENISHKPELSAEFVGRQRGSFYEK